MQSDKPYWEMSRITMEGLGRFDRLYKDQKKRIYTTKFKHRATTSLNKTPKKTHILPQATTPKLREKKSPKIDEIGEIEHVGFKPSEYKAYPKQEPLRGRTAPAEFGSRDIFKDCHTPIQVTKRFQGDPILSVPIKNTPFNVAPKEPPKKRELPRRKLAEPIHDVLFEESVDQHENIDPWGYSSNEKVVCPEINLRGIHLKVSRL